MTSPIFAPRTVITADGARLAAYVREPSGTPPCTTVVLSHGWTLAHQSWDLVTDLLPSGLRVVTYDQRGHGRSTFAGGSRKPRQESVRRLGADLATVIAECVPEESPLVLGGHSMGGMSTLAYAGLHPESFEDRVQRVLLTSTAMCGLSGAKVPGAAGAMRLFSHIPGRLGSLITEKNQLTLFGDDPEPTALKSSRAVAAGTSLRTFGSFYGALMKYDESASASTLAAVPTTVVVGTRDRLTSKRLGTELASAIPGSELRVLDGVGHMTPYERPAVLAAILLGEPVAG